jgi:hypothetical protein
MKAYLLLYENGNRVVACLPAKTDGSPRDGDFRRDEHGYLLAQWYNLAAYLNGTGDIQIVCDDLASTVQADKEQ